MKYARLFLLLSFFTIGVACGDKNDKKNENRVTDAGDDSHTISGKNDNEIVSDDNDSVLDDQNKLDDIDDTSLISDEDDQTPIVHECINPEFGLKLKKDTYLCPGTFEFDGSDNENAISVDEDNIFLDCQNASIISKSFKGFAIGINGRKSIIIKNCKAEGFWFGAVIRDSEDVKIQDSDFSRNFSDSAMAWQPFFPEPGWQKTLGGGILIENSDKNTISNVTATGGNNGVAMFFSDYNIIENNIINYNYNAGVQMVQSSYNDIIGNTADHNIRFDKNCSTGGCDSASILIEFASNHNNFEYNDMTYSGDGYFMRSFMVCSNFNNVSHNDGSYSPHNCFESNFCPGSIFEKNKANYCDHGFWIGYTQETIVRGNEVKYNNNGISIEHGINNKIIGNTIEGNLYYGIKIWNDLDKIVYQPPQNTLIAYNEIGKTGTFFQKAYGIVLTSDPSLEPIKDIYIHANKFYENTAGDIYKTSYDNIPETGTFTSTQTALHIPFIALKPVTQSKINDTITLSADIKGVAGPFEVEWIFGDGNHENQTSSKVALSSSHKYANEGNYTANVIARTKDAADIKEIDFSVQHFRVLKDLTQTSTNADTYGWNDLAEDNADVWEATSNDFVPYSIENDTAKVLYGNSSLKIITTTYNPFYVWIPKQKSKTFDISHNAYMVFWMYTENYYRGWQDWENNPEKTYPKLIIADNKNRKLTIYPSKYSFMRQANTDWWFYRIPLDEMYDTNDQWTITKHAEFDSKNVNQISFEFDSWYQGYTIWFDGMRFEAP